MEPGSSVTEVSDQSGNLVERYEYDVYGAPTIFDSSETSLGTSSIGNPYLFTGRRFGPESGNYYYRARTYSPELGRFLQTDPLGYVGALNLYAYVGNNPVSWVDPDGYACEAPHNPHEQVLSVKTVSVFFVSLWWTSYVSMQHRITGHTEVSQRRPAAASAGDRG